MDRALFDLRREPTRFLRDQAPAVVAAGAAMARRFRDGGALFVVAGGAAASDAAHVAVEFIHPVIVGKRALPSRYLGDPDQLELYARPRDIALTISAGSLDDSAHRALHAARSRGALTVALTGSSAPVPAADHVVRTSGSAVVAQELQVTTYHLLWEISHVCLEQGDVVVPACETSGHCITCADEAVPVRIAELLDDDRALVDTGAGLEEVSVALVDARVGETILVHAREAIGVVPS